MEIFEYTFFQNALIGVIITALAASLIGVYVVTRRMVFLAGGITHACFGGLGLAYFLGLNPLAMAAVFAVAGSLGVEWMSDGNRHIRRDSAIGVVWALGMALGILFIFMTEGFVPELNSFLFGNVLSIADSDLVVFGTFTVILVLFFIFFRKLIMAVSFDADFARTRHLPVGFVNIAMTVLVALGIVLIIRMIGVMLLMSLISIPQLTAELFCRRYVPMIGLSLLFSLVGGIGGLFIAYFISVPASATIVLLLILFYFAGCVIRRLRG